MSANHVLDAPRDEAGRTVIDRWQIAPYIDEIDGSCIIPIRLVHRTDAGLVLEVGPYTLECQDVDRLRAAVHSYDVADSGTKTRRIK